MTPQPTSHFDIFRRAVTALVAATAMLAMSPLQAQTFPSKSVVFVNPFPPGGPSDILARSMADVMQQTLKQTFIVQNKAGAGGDLGAESVAKSAPDGYTVLIGIDTTFTVNPSIYQKTPYKLTDLKPVMILGSSGLLLGANPASNVKTISELIARGRDKGLTLSSGSNGSPGHLAAAILSESAKVKVTHVPYKGNSPAVIAIVAGDVDGGILATPGMLPQVKANKITALAVTSAKRSLLAPNVPTVAEAGLKDLALEVYYVAMVPAATPPEVVEVLRKGMADALARPEVKARLDALDLVVMGESGKAAEQRLEQLRQRYAPIIKATGMQVE